MQWDQPHRHISNFTNMHGMQCAHCILWLVIVNCLGLRLKYACDGIIHPLFAFETEVPVLILYTWTSSGVLPIDIMERQRRCKSIASVDNSSDRLGQFFVVAHLCQLCVEQFYEHSKTTSAVVPTRMQLSLATQSMWAAAEYM